MSVKLFNKKTGGTAVCERADWVACRDHNASKGWVLYTPDMENSPERKSYIALLDEVLDNGSGTVSPEDYEILDAQNEVLTELSLGEEDGVSRVPRLVETVNADPYSEDYAERAAALRKKNVEEVRTLGIGSDFKVVDPKDGPKQDNTIWFGHCDKCGQLVSNDERLGLWEHRIVKPQDKKGNLSIEYVLSCPN